MTRRKSMTEEDQETDGDPTADQGRDDANELDDFLREFAEHVEPEGPAEGSDFLDIGLPTAAGMARSAADVSSAEASQEEAAVEADEDEGEFEGAEADIGSSISLRQLDSLLEGDVVGASLPDDRIEELRLEDIVAEETEDVEEAPSIPGLEGAEVVDTGDEIDLTAAIMSAAGLPMPVEAPEDAEAEPEETVTGDEAQSELDELEEVQPVGVEPSELEAISADMISDASDVGEPLDDEPAADSGGPDLPGVTGEQEVLEVGDEVDLTDAIMQAAEAGPAEEAPAEEAPAEEAPAEETAAEEAPAEEVAAEEASAEEAPAEAEPEAAQEAAIPDEGIFETVSPVEELAAAEAKESPAATVTAVAEVVATVAVTETPEATTPTVAPTATAEPTEAHTTAATPEPTLELNLPKFIFSDPNEDGINLLTGQPRRNIIPEADIVTIGLATAGPGGQLTTRNELTADGFAGPPAFAVWMGLGSRPTVI